MLLADHRPEHERTPRVRGRRCESAEASWIVVAVAALLAAGSAQALPPPDARVSGDTPMARFTARVGAAPAGLSAVPDAVIRPTSAARRLGPPGGMAAILAPSLAYNRSIESREPERPEIQRPTRLHRMAAAFRQELREESLTFRDASPWATVPDELLDDVHVREARERAAERILAEAASDAIETLVFGRDPNRKHRVRLASASRTGFDIDGTPSWRIRTGSERTGMRVDVPLTHSALRIRCWRRLGTERGLDRIAATVALDPWDNEARVAVRLDF